MDAYLHVNYIINFSYLLVANVIIMSTFGKDRLINYIGTAFGLQ